MIYCNLLGKCDAEDKNFQKKWRIENNEQKKQKQICRKNTIEDAAQVFLQACKESLVVFAVIITCTGKHAVVIFDHTKYENVSSSIMNNSLPLWSECYIYPRQNKYWICKTCNHSLQNVEMFLQT